MSIDPIRRFEYFGLVASVGSMAVLLMLTAMGTPHWAIVGLVFALGLAIGGRALPPFVAVFFPSFLSVRKIDRLDIVLREEQFWGTVPGHPTLRASGSAFKPYPSEFVSAYLAYARAKLPNGDDLIIQLGPWVYDAVFASRSDAEAFRAGLSKHDAATYYLRLIPFFRFLDLRTSARGKAMIVAQIILSGIVCASAVALFLIG